MEQQKIIHIGFHKTGSTFLQNYFSLHPSIYHDRTRFKYYEETGLIDEELLETDLNYKYDVLSEELLSIWSGNIDGTSPFSKYQLDFDIQKKQHEVAKRLKNLFPNAKVIIVVRDIRTLINAIYSQYLFSGGTKSIKHQLKEQWELLLKMYNYDYVIKCYLDYFGKDNVVILPFEFLKENPKEFLIYLENKFGFKHFDFSTDKIHSSLNNFTMPIVRTLNILAKFYVTYFVQTKNKRKKFMNYLAWLYNFKENKLKYIKLGHKMNVYLESKMVLSFIQNCQLVKFDEELKQFQKHYEL